MDSTAILGGMEKQKFPAYLQGIGPRPADLKTVSLRIYIKYADHT
jgi:hypothetical protein